LARSTQPNIVEKVAINNALPLKATRRDVVAKLKLKSFWGFESELQTNPMPSHLDSLWSATLVSECDGPGPGVEQNTEGG